MSTSIHPKKYGVAIIAQGAIRDVPCRYLTLREAKAYARAYNRVYDERYAVVMRHPFSRALALSKPSNRKLAETFDDYPANIPARKPRGRSLAGV